MVKTKHLAGSLEIVATSGAFAVLLLPLLPSSMLHDLGYNSVSNWTPNACSLKHDCNAMQCNATDGWYSRALTRATMCWNYKRKPINIKWHLGKMCESNCKIHEHNLQSILILHSLTFYAGIVHLSHSVDVYECAICIEVGFCRNYRVCMPVGIAAGNLCHASREFHMLSWLMFAKQNLTAYTLLTPSYDFSETNTLTHTQAVHSAHRAIWAFSSYRIQYACLSIC